jgi:unsaturated chondroitin disaccharide hydrolase
MIRIDPALTPKTLEPCLERLFELSAKKIRDIDKTWDADKGAPAITVVGRYASRAWTEWTQGFQFGSALLQFDATGEDWFLQYARRHTLQVMPSHLSHVGVHDHGFNIISTYGNLARLIYEGKIEADQFEKDLYHLALKVSGAVQAARWSRLRDGRGYIYSFNGPHSLFADTIRSLRSLALSHRLGQALMAESDERVSLLRRLVDHALVTAQHNVYYGEGRDAYDVCGRVSHEAIFNINDGTYRCPNTQQGYSPFTTWTRGLAWIILGFAEQLEFLEACADQELAPLGGREAIEAAFRRAATVTSDYYMQQSAADGICYWDTGAPGLAKLGDYLNKSSDPYNDWEPVDSSAAVIAAQGLWRLGNYLARSDRSLEPVRRYRQAALTMVRTLFSEPYLSLEPYHQGLILHSVYHRPRGWDFIPPGRRIPCSESSMWGDYHARELALAVLREIRNEPWLAFFNA